MDYVETEGNSIDEAIENALKALGAERAKVEIEILANATRGLFGLGGKKARVRASLRRRLSDPPAPAEPARPAPPAADRPFEPRVAASPMPPAAEPPSAPNHPAETRLASASGAAGEVAPPPGAAPATPVRPARTRAGEPAPSPRPAEPRPPARPASPPPPPMGPEAIEHGRALLHDLVSRMGFTASVEVQAEPEHTVLSLQCEESSVLIGRRGQTLDALEYLVNRIVAREDDHSARFAVDCERYRQRRQQALEELAHRVAERARRRGRAVTLNPMSPRDRRIVHLALRQERGLTTRSSGKGYYRKLLVIPEGDRRGPRPRSERREL
jgi:spoIIIJ-associated protein